MKKVHFTAIGGAIMHSLAIALHRQGYVVSGSDDKIADPARTHLAHEGILPPTEGFFPEKITTDLEAVILGMHARVDNVELLRAQELGIPVLSFPQYIYEVSKNKKRIVIAGSHGKTTITSMVMHVLHTSGLDIDYIVGAQVKGFDTGVRLSAAAPIIVLEGDEYLASPIERESKFLFYKPHIALLTGIAWDHINVFPVYADYVHQFKRFVDTVPTDGVIVYYSQDAELNLIMEKYQGGATLLPYATPAYEVRHHQCYITYAGQEYQMIIFGTHNMQNMEGARLVCNQVGISNEQFYTAMTTFEGAANRLEKLNDNSHTVVYKDFAHSPSKLQATVRAMKEQYPTRLLVAVMELHTFSSLNKDFLIEYNDTLKQADRAIVFLDEEAMALKRMPPLDPALIKTSFGRADIEVITTAAHLEKYLIAQDWKEANLLLMSSGHFGGMKVKEVANSIVNNEH